jgi:hypothetical protein
MARTVMVDRLVNMLSCMRRRYRFVEEEIPFCGKREEGK